MRTNPTKPLSALHIPWHTQLRKKFYDCLTTMNKKNKTIVPRSGKQYEARLILKTEKIWGSLVSHYSSSLRNTLFLLLSWHFSSTKSSCDGQSSFLRISYIDNLTVSYMKTMCLDPIYDQLLTSQGNKVLKIKNIYTTTNQACSVDLQESGAQKQVKTCSSRTGSVCYSYRDVERDHRHAPLSLTEHRV